MIELVIGQIEIVSVLECTKDLVASQAELAGLTLYPLPHNIIVDSSKIFLAEFKSIIAND